MGLLVESEHHVAVPPAFPCDLGEAIGAEALGRHQRLEVVLDGNAGQARQYSCRDGIGRDPENRPALVVDSLIELQRHLAGADGRDEEQPGRGIPTHLVDQGLSAGNDFGRVRQIGGVESGRSRKGKHPSRKQDRCRDWGARPHISPGAGNVGSQSTNRREGKKKPRMGTKDHQGTPKSTKE